MTSIQKRHIAGLALGLVTVVASHTSRADISYYVNQSGPIDFDSRDIDFTSVSIPTSTTGITASLKMLTLELATNNNQSQCLEITTSGDGTGDTKIWYSNPMTNDFASLNDDVPGSLYSKVRVWILLTPNTYTYGNIYITGFNNAYNGMKFTVNIWKLPPTTTEAQCTAPGSALKVWPTGHNPPVVAINPTG